VTNCELLFDGDKNFLPGMARAAGLDVENVHAPFDNANNIWTDSINADDIVKWEEKQL
jgi:hypothetical protein